MHSLRWRLTLVFLLVIIVSTGVTTSLTVWHASRLFETYVSQSRATYLEQVAQSIARHYTGDGDWSAVRSILADMPLAGNDRRVGLEPQVFGERLPR